MSTRLSLFCNRIIEAGWLVALVVIPLHFDPSSSRLFEPDKIALLRSIAVVMWGAWLVKAVEAWRVGKTPGAPSASPASDPSARRLALHPLVLSVFLFLASYVVATAFSILPRVSLWGYYERLQGLYTTAAYVVVFCSVLALVRTRPQVQRLITATLLASLPMALYGILEHFDLGPFEWVDPLIGRVQSTMGNPIFLAATLAMAVPLTLYRLAEAGRKRRFLLLGCYLALLALQLACILFTQSRGPVLGLTVGLLFAGLLWALTRQRWRAAKGVVGLTVVLAAFLVVINLPNSPLSFVQDVPYLSRLTRVADVEGSAEGRVLVWEGAAALIAADAKRLAVGYGPETIRFAYYPYYNAALGRIHGWRPFVDRTHNETFDVLVTTGVLGFFIYVLLFSVLVHYALRWTGLVASSRQRDVFLALWLLGGVGAVVATRLVAQTWALSGIALPAGLLGGLFLYLAGYAFYASRKGIPAGEPTAPRWVALLVVLLVAGILGHFVETNVGIAVSATRLLFWVYTALLVALGVFFCGRPEAAMAGEDAPASPRPPADSLAVMSLGVGLMLVVMAYSFFARGTSTAEAFVVVGLLGATWLLAGVLLLAEAGAAGRVPLRVPGTYAGLSLAPLGLFFALDAAGRAVASLHLIFYYLVVLLVLAAAAFFLARSARSSAPRSTRWGIVLASVGALAAAVLIYQTNLRIIEANRYHLQAKTAFEQRQYDQAVSYYQRALDLDPGQELYQLELAQLLAAKAYYRSTEPSERDQLFREAEGLLMKAAARNPFEQYHPAALGDVYRRWAAKATEAQPRTERYQLAVAAFAEAIRRNPENVLVWTAWAETAEEMGDLAQAVEKYRQVLAWDSTNAPLYLQIGNLYSAQGRWQPAAEMYQEALRHSRRPLPTIHQALAVLYGRLERLDDAVRESEQAVALRPDLLAYREVLIGFYERQGRCSDALDQARAALRRWPDNEPLRARIALLRRQCGQASGPR